MALAAVAAVTGAAVGLAGTGGHGGSAAPGSGMAPADYVLMATHATMTHRTAHLVITGSVTADGEVATESGSGAIDLANRQVNVTMDVSVPGHSLVEREAASGGDLFIAVSEDGHDVAPVPGKHWIEVPDPVGASGSFGEGTSDPVAELQLLAKAGNTVRSLGSKTISGTVVSGYAVTVSRANITSAMERYSASSGLPAVAQQALRQAAQSLQPMTFDVWFDSSNLLRRMSLDMRMTMGAGSAATSMSMSMTMDLVDYGAPVSITTPAPGDVEPFGQLLATSQVPATATG